MLKENKGITLISLVITIIVLLILAGISIGMLTGENGIINEAKEARLQSDFGSVKEGTSLAVTEYNMEKYTENQQKPFLEWLQEKGYIDENNTVNTQNLLGQTLSTGNGEVTGTTDVYKIQDQSENQEIATTKVAITNTEEKTFELSYYDEKGSKKELATFTMEETSGLEETDPNLFEVNGEGIITLKDYESYYYGDIGWEVENVVIPQEVDGKKVTKIDGKLFDQCYGASNIKSIVIPEGVTEILDSSIISLGNTIGAFSYIDNLETVKLPSTLTGIGNYAFLGCRSLSNINLPENLYGIGVDAFSGCTSLSNINLPENLYGIGDEAFLGCTSLSNINLPENLVYIGAGAFGGCISIQRIEIPQSVEIIGMGAFEGWTENQTIKVPFKEGEPAPEGWDEEWNLECNAKIEYAE